jgi:DNA ligase (NAD+)
MLTEKEIINLIQQYNESYYNGTSIVDDDVYDSIKQQLYDINPNHELFVKIGTNIPSTKEWKKHKHSIFMGSQNKAKNIEELKDWYDNYSSHQIIVQEKIDGISISLDYENGKLVRAITRGNGEIGEDVYKNIINIQNIAKEIRYTESITIRGEIFLCKESFEKINLILNKENNKPFTTLRNATSGIVRNTSGRFCNELMFIMYDSTLFYQYQTDIEHLHNLNEYCISMMYTTSTICNTIEEIEKIYNNYIDNKRINLSYDIDGLVIKINDLYIRKKQGIVNNRPKGEIALKFPSKQAISILQDVEWNVTRTGRINPKAIITPVEIDGAIITKATLHNYNYITDVLGGLSIGDNVIIERKGDIIPKITSVISRSNNNFISYPTLCPSCGNVTKKEDTYIICDNLKCKDRVISSIYYFLEVLGVENIGERFVELLYEYDRIRNIIDIFELQQEDIYTIPGFGEKISNDFLKQLKEKTNTTLSIFLISLGLDLFGDMNVNKMIDFYGENETYNIITNNTYVDLQCYSNPNTASLIMNQILQYNNIIKSLFKFITIKKAEKISNILEGMSFCITGDLLLYSREEAINIIKQYGGEYKTGVSKKLNYLITNDTSTGTSKNKKAIELGISIITENTFLSMIGKTIYTDTKNNQEGNVNKLF